MLCLLWCLIVVFVAVFVADIGCVCRSALVKAYLTFINSEEAQAMVSDYSFVALPSVVSDLNAAGIATLILHPDSEEFTFEDSTMAVDGAGTTLMTLFLFCFLAPFQTHIYTYIYIYIYIYMVV